LHLSGVDQGFDWRCNFKSRVDVVNSKEDDGATRHFTPFVCSTNGMLGREAATFAKRLAAKLAAKWQRTYSQVCGYVKARLSIAIVRATHLCLCAVSLPTKSAPDTLWEDGAGLALFKC
jgi:hypothetical protein